MNTLMVLAQLATFGYLASQQGALDQKYAPRIQKKNYSATNNPFFYLTQINI